mmetsp:Transcript_156121/g.479139  ORF Transcript_156121/g.479139 Transcript_156121/m.479139 type:complete len:114 (-) Transcript_156121:97-438(-)
MDNSIDNYFDDGFDNGVHNDVHTGFDCACCNGADYGSVSLPPGFNDKGVEGGSDGSERHDLKVEPVKPGFVHVPWLPEDVQVLRDAGLPTDRCFDGFPVDPPQQRGRLGMRRR